MQMIQNYFRYGLATLTILSFGVFGCSKSIDSKYVGEYFDVNNSSNRIDIRETGACQVYSPDKTFRAFWCNSDDGFTISMKAVTNAGSSTDEGFSLPEFRGSISILTIDGNTLITQTGRRFSRKETISNSSTSSSTSNSSSSSSSSDSSKITIEKAQSAIDKFASANGSGSIRIKGGVREIPAQNAATAELDVSNFTNLNGRQFKDGRGIAGFSRYTDGKWSLSEVVILYNGFDKQTWTPTIELR